MMRLPPFAYHAPSTAAEVAHLLKEEGPTASIVAGGTDLYPNMKRRHQLPQTLVSLRNVHETRGIEMHDDGAISLGAGTILRDIERHEAVVERPAGAPDRGREHQHARASQHGNDRRQRCAWTRAATTTTTRTTNGGAPSTSA